jgi:phosphoesterase RecJ-like protein
MKRAEELEKIISASSTITVTAHTHPDGDAIGSGCAMLRYLREMKGKKAALIVPTPIPASLSFIAKDGDTVLSFKDEPQKCQEWIEASDLIICQDCNSFSRVNGAEQYLRDSAATKVLIDHHLNPEAESFSLVISQIDISSTSELLYWTLKDMSDVEGDISRLPQDCLDALMTGMTTDTNNFANSVFPTTLTMASELLAAGVDRDKILCSLYNNYRENRLRLMGFMLKDKMTILSNGVSYMILDKATQEKYDFEDGDTEGFVNMPLALAKVNVSIFITEEEEKFRVSIRSKRGFSANSFAMKYFNGGGHEHAAGGSIFFGKDITSPEEAEAYLIKSSKDFFTE